MVQKINVSGIEIKYMTAHEAVRTAETLLFGDALSTIGTITTELLSVARTDERVRRCISGFDLAVIGDPSILRMAGLDSAPRLKEIKNRDFFNEFMLRLVRSRRTVFLLSGTKERLAGLRTYFEKWHEKLEIVGEYALEDCVEDPDKVVNEINALMPDVILSVLESPEQEHFLMEHGSMLGARLWYGVGDFEKVHKKIGFFSSFFHHFVVK